MWARKYAHCIECGTTERQHYGGGRCARCYNRKRTREHPEPGRARSRRRYWANPELLRAQSTEYHRTHREQANLRNRLRREEKDFAGNRRAVIERDGGCIRCGATSKLIVHHIDGQGGKVPERERNNALENLITLCRACHIREHEPRKTGQGPWGLPTPRCSVPSCPNPKHGRGLCRSHYMEWWRTGRPCPRSSQWPAEE